MKGTGTKIKWVHYRSWGTNSGRAKSKMLTRISIPYTSCILHAFSKDKLKLQICIHTCITCIFSHSIDKTVLVWKWETKKCTHKSEVRITGRYNWCWQDGRIPLHRPQIQFKLNWGVNFSCHSECLSWITGRLPHYMPSRWFFRILDHDQSIRHCHKSLSNVIQKLLTLGTKHDGHFLSKISMHHSGIPKNGPQVQNCKDFFVSVYLLTSKISSGFTWI